MSEESELIALIDLDGSVANFDQRLLAALNSMRSPNEPELAFVPHDAPDWMEIRMDYIKQRPGFWQNLATIPEGMAVVQLMREYGYTLNVLSKGPVKATNAWSEKLIWIQTFIPDADVSIVYKKGRHYGRVLFDDWPSYIEAWLKYRPRGQVLMLDQSWNQYFAHPQVTRVGKGEAFNEASVIDVLLKASGKPYIRASSSAGL